MLIEHDGKTPRIDSSVYIAPGAIVCGDVTIAAGCRVLFNAVVTADGGSVEIGRNCIVMEHALIRGRLGHPTVIGDNVLVGPHSHINGATIEENAFIATGASIFPGAHIGRRASTRINSVVHVNSSLADDAVVPIGWVAVGSPALTYPPEEHDRIWEILRRLDFPHTVFGLTGPSAGDTIMPEAMARYSELFGRHRDDRVVN